MTLNIVRDPDYADVLRIVVDGRWTWHDMTGLLEELAETLEKRNGKTSVIIDFNHSAHMPVGFNESAANIVGLDARIRAGADRLIFAGASGLQRVALEMLLRLMPEDSRHYAIAPSVEEAFTLLARQPAGVAGGASL